MLWGLAGCWEGFFLPVRRPVRGPRTLTFASVPADVQAGMQAISTSTGVVTNTVVSINGPRTVVTLNNSLFYNVPAGLAVFFCWGGGGTQYKVGSRGATYIRTG
jgi:hypothetical protein